MTFNQLNAYNKFQKMFTGKKYTKDQKKILYRSMKDSTKFKEFAKVAAEGRAKTFFFDKVFPDFKDVLTPTATATALADVEMEDAGAGAGADTEMSDKGISGTKKKNKDANKQLPEEKKKLVI